MTMKTVTTIIAVTLLSLLPVTFVQAQEAPKPAAGEKNAAPAGAGKRTDVYHVHFTKAALGKAVQLGDWLKTPDSNNPMPDHFIVLRHQDGGRMGLCGYHTSRAKSDDRSCGHRCASHLGLTQAPYKTC
jgi:hypothetical protein